MDDNNARNKYEYACQNESRVDTVKFLQYLPLLGDFDHYMLIFNETDQDVM